MRELIPPAEEVAAHLRRRKATIVVAEASSGGLISAALLAVPGASDYFVGGGVLYTRKAILTLRDTRESMFAGERGGTESWALMLAHTLRERSGATWCLGESGAAGPAGNKYGDPPGHTCLVVVGPGVERALTHRTGSADRVANMLAFAAAGLSLLVQVLGEQ
jgi:PncC family amidohydrolase